MIGLVAWFLDGLAVNGLWAGVQAAIVTGIVSWLGHLLLGDARKVERE
jgi:putative membrane protein